MAAATFRGRGSLMSPGPLAGRQDMRAVREDRPAPEPRAGQDTPEPDAGRSAPESPTPHPSMHRSLFWAFFVMGALVLLACVVASALLMQRSIIDASERELLQECAAIGAALDASDDPVELVRGIDMDDTRLTLIDPDGTVVYDNRQDAALMANHADRPEVQAALGDGTGTSVRSSATLSQVLLYGAQRLDDGQVLRLSLSRNGALGSLINLLPMAVVVLVALVALCYGVSSVLARRLVAPLDVVDPSHPLDHDEGAYRELMPLLRRMDEQRRQIDEQVLRLNDNDRMRVEFTANVTHELKTPLTSISGYAELIETGLAAPADVPEFARRIHEEAQHLTSLVNDILTLSKMDEAERVDGALGTCEPVDLAQVAQSVVGRLAGRASDADVTFELVGANRPVNAMGMPKLVDQIIYNLCDNATRYNRPGGTITVTTGVAQDGRPYVSVADTGIGIAPENLEKVFARFYRVDASRSRQTGGTGLGLAIVKHAARCHDARLDISSELGTGTTITVSFHDAQDTAWLRTAGAAGERDVAR